MPAGGRVMMRPEENAEAGAGFNGHFRDLNWRYLPYIRPI